MVVIEVSSRNEPIDEIKQFQMGRFINSNEAIWRILGFNIHERYPAVVHLQRVYFSQANDHQIVANPRHTTLTTSFHLCQSDDFAKTLLYHEVPKYFTWNNSKLEFQRRKQGKAVPGYADVRASDALGRVYTVHPNNAECFYLRMLLHEIRGPTSFQALKTINGDVCETYREACNKLGLLENDQHWDTTLTEASTFAPHGKTKNIVYPSALR